MASNKLRILDDFPSKIPANKLPTNADIIKAICFQKENTKTTKQDSVKVIANQVYELWKRTMIPVVSKERLDKKLSAYFEEYIKLSQSNTDRKSYGSKVDKFKVNKIAY